MKNRMGIFQKEGLSERISQNVALVSWKNANFQTVLSVENVFKKTGSCKEIECEHRP